MCDAAAWQAWVGRVREAEDVVTPRLAACFRATFAPHLAAVDEDTAPLGLHWCLAPEIADAEGLGGDGHPRRGDFWPPVALPRRMWAGGTLRLHAALRVGDRVRRRSVIGAVEEKYGRSGPLCFVTVQHEFHTDAGLAIEESQSIVYRGAAAGGRVPPAAAMPVEAQHEREVAVDTVLLFRYSALTFNGHRIHYDAPYAVLDEEYSGLVVHGPLQATLLLNFAATLRGRAPRHFTFRAVRPAAGTRRLRLGATPAADGDVALSARSADGAVTMTAWARW